MVSECVTGRLPQGKYAPDGRLSHQRMRAMPPNSTSRETPLLSDDGYIIEFHQVGAYVKVSVMDPVSLTEVSMVTPASMSQGQAAQAAIRKLKYVMARRNGTVADGSAGERK
jgi:hypothetical protein